MKTFQQIDVPGDNLCFFHAVGIFLCMNANEVKQLCIRAIHKYADVPSNGVTLREWIYMENNLTLDKYIQHLQRKSFWGGAIEMHALSLILQRPVVVYEQYSKGKGRKISVFHETLQSVPISLLYMNRNHYAALVPM